MRNSLTFDFGDAEWAFGCRDVGWRVVSQPPAQARSFPADVEIAASPRTADGVRILSRNAIFGDIIPSLWGWVAAGPALDSRFVRWRACVPGIKCTLVYISARPLSRGASTNSWEFSPQSVGWVGRPREPTVLLCSRLVRGRPRAHPTTDSDAALLERPTRAPFGASTYCGCGRAGRRGRQ
jgi:hypothetical protein